MTDAEEMEKGALEALEQAVDEAAEEPSSEPREPEEQETQPREETASEDGREEAVSGDRAETRKESEGEEAEEDDKKRAAKDARQKSDFVNDPIPEDLKGRTRERLEGLIATVKSVSQERDQLRRDIEEFYRLIEEARVTPEQYASTMEALKRLNADDDETRREGVKALRQIADRVAKELGEDLPGEDPLEGHEDLKQEVEDGDITRERAIEIARARNRERAAAARREKAGRLSEEERARAAAIERARVELNALGAELKRADPAGYAAKTRALLPAVQRMVKRLPPEEWAEAYRELYENLALPASAAVSNVAADGRRRAPAGTGARQPLRHQPGAGAGAVPEPKSVEEAIELGISQAMR